MKDQVSTFSRKEARSYFPYPIFIKHLPFMGCNVEGKEQGSYKTDSSIGSLPGAATFTGVSKFLSKRPNSKYFAFTGKGLCVNLTTLPR